MGATGTASLMSPDFGQQMRIVNKPGSSSVIAFLVIFGLLVSAYLLLRPDASVEALAALTDPAKLATLETRRAANPRLLKCVYWLHDAKVRGRVPEAIIAKAQAATNSTGARAELVKKSLLRNLDIAEKLGCLTPENLERLRRGSSPAITLGPYAGQIAEVDHIVPVSVVPELDKELANLELMPAVINRKKGAKIGARQLDYIKRFVSAGIISEQVAERVRSNAPREFP